jgi:hypothetical protein
MIGFLWFLNFSSLIKKIKDGQDEQNSTVLGAFLPFLLLFVIMYAFAGFTNGKLSP